MDILEEVISIIDKLREREREKGRERGGGGGGEGGRENQVPIQYIIAQTNTY